MIEEIRPMMIDVDDVLADFVLALIMEYGPPTGDDIELTSGHLEKGWPDLDIARIIADEEFYKDMPIVPYANVGIQALIKRNRVFQYVSARPENLLEVTMEWLHNNDFPKAPTLCLGREGKIRAIQNGVYRLVLDDHARYLNAAVDAKTPHVVFDRPWNKDVKGPRLVDWREAHDILPYV